MNNVGRTCAMSELMRRPCYNHRSPSFLTYLPLLHSSSTCSTGSLINAIPMPKDKHQENPAVRTLRTFGPSSNTTSGSSKSNIPAMGSTVGSSQDSNSSNNTNIPTTGLPPLQAAATLDQSSRPTTLYSTAGSSTAVIDHTGSVRATGDALSWTQSALGPIRAKYQGLSDDKAKCGSERTPLDRGCSG